MAYLNRRFSRSLMAVVFSASLLLGRISTAQRVENSPPSADSIEGLVVNSLTNEPIARALVSSPDNSFAALTDTQGHFQFKLPANALAAQLPNASPPARPFSLSARRPGYLQGPNSTRNLPVDSQAHNLTLSLTPEAIVIGHVSLPSSEVPGAIQVELYRRQIQEGFGRWVPAGSASAKHDGSFRFAELEAGDYKLLTRELLDRDPLTFDPRAPLYGYPPVYYPNAADFFSAKTLSLTAGAIFQADISLVRQPYFPVKIAVANANPGGMGITVAAEGRPGPGYSLGYNPGTQTIEGLLPSGYYTVEAASFGQISATGSVNISVKGAALEGPRMVLIANLSIDVRLKEEFNRDANSAGNVGPSGPLGSRIDRHAGRSGRYLSVFLEPAEDFGRSRGGYFRAPTGRADDALVIENVQPGRYWVKINSPIGFASAVTAAGVDLKRQPLVAGAVASPIEITMRNDGAEVDGNVEGENAAAPASLVSQPRVYLIPLPDSGGDFRELWVTADGKFQSGIVPPGTYLVLAFAEARSDLEYRDPNAMRMYESKGVIIHLVAGQQEHLRPRLILPGE